MQNDTQEYNTKYWFRMQAAHDGQASENAMVEFV